MALTEDQRTVAELAVKLLPRTMAGPEASEDALIDYVIEMARKILARVQQTDPAQVLK